MDNTNLNFANLHGNLKDQKIYNRQYDEKEMGTQYERSVLQKLSPLLPDIASTAKTKTKAAGLVPGSGNGSQKGDIVTPRTLIECKWTSKQSYPLRARTLEKICREADAVSKYPMLINSIQGQDYVTLRLDDFIGMIEDGTFTEL